MDWLHMCSVLAALLFDDEQQLCSQVQDDSPVAPASRSPHALKKTHSKRTEDNLPVHSFGTLLADRRTIVKNRVQPKLSKGGIYSHHLQRQLWNLQQEPSLAAAFGSVVRSKAPVELDLVEGFKLQSMGLVHLVGDRATVSCQL